MQCSQCQKNQTSLQCGLCGCSICKYCGHILGADRFSFLTEVPEVLKHDVYCNPCFNEQVAGPLAEYDDLMELAGQIDIFMKDQGKETRLLKRIEKPITITECLDEGELLMRLAFRAVQMGYNAVIDVEIKGQKVRDGAYQYTKYSGRGVPTMFSADRVPKDKSIWHNPN